jgi:hypothetical protein
VLLLIIQTLLMVSYLKLASRGRAYYDKRGAPPAISSRPEVV